MQHGLPRRIRLAFVTQGVIAGVVICLLTLAGSLLVRHFAVEQAVKRETAAFWAALHDGETSLPRSTTMSSYFVPAQGDIEALPPSLRNLPPGLHHVPELLGRTAYVDEKPAGRFVLVYNTSLLDTVILWTAFGLLLLALLTGLSLSFWTYRTSKRLVAPVSWLADVVLRWDPRAPDTSVIRSPHLPLDSGPEVLQLTGALTGLADRVAQFVQRERDFTRDASHELRTPLTVIRVATDLMLADPEASSRQLRSLQRVHRAGRDMEAVIDAFLILAREAEVEPLSEEFDVREIVAHEVARVQPLLAGRPIELDVIDEGVPHLFAPPHVLAVMVGNLLGNAVRFTDAGHIQLHLLPDRIEVHDTGIGMTPEALAKAFDPFYRADPMREEGRGMGLSIVRRLGERFGWPVALNSAPGVGTTAVIRFA
ncbi:sensor histidine kinase [Lysobacter fragariae]